MNKGMLCLAMLGMVMISHSGPADARDEIVEARGWQQVDLAEAGACRAEVRTNGQFYQIAGSGFRPGEEVQFHLVNDAVKQVNWGEIKPIRFRFRADSSGAWHQFYIPFVPNHDGRTRGGNVTIALDSASCRLAVGFPWHRRELTSWISEF